jgi:hypothetical protein
MAKKTQISALISESTRARLEKHVRATVEELPADVIVHPRIVVTLKSFEEVVKQMESTKPTQALRDLLRD